MPIYDYRCADCKNDFAVERSMSDDSQQHCVSCDSDNVNRIWTAVVSLTGGSTADYGQGTFGSASSAPRKSACGSCVSRACGTCH
jgi:putative FmdB family regulatory protein